MATVNRSVMVKPIWLTLILIGVLLGSGACANRSRTVDRLAQDREAVEDFDGSLTFKDVTLEQANEKGQPWWRVKAKRATYSQDKKLAQLDSPKGELLQDGKPVFAIAAKKGEVQQDGKKIVMRGQIMAKDIRHGVVMQGNELEWRPEEDLLIVRDRLVGDHKDLKIAAQEARAFSRQRRIELTGKVVALSKDPVVQVQTQRLIWLLNEERIISETPLQVDRFEKNKLVDRGAANRGEINLKTKIAQLQQNARVQTSDPAMQIAGNSLLWNFSNRTLIANQPVNIAQPQQQILLSANQGRLDQTTRVAFLEGNVRGVGQRNQSELTSNQLIWNIPTQEFEALGNVFYRQANPPFNLKGPRAVGTLRGQIVVVSGGRVVTEIIP